MARRLTLVFVALLACLGVAFALGPRVPVDTAVRAPTLPEDLDAYLVASEAALPDLTPGTEKTIVWAHPDRHDKTPLSLVYLHGFSATRQEIAPVCDRVATQLEANLYYARLTGHGRPGEAMGDATVHDWLQDSEEALAIGQRLGERVVLIGTSTGGTLATWLASRTPDLASLVLISPNFGVADPAASLLTLPWGGALAELVTGPSFEWTPANPQQGLYWTVRYPTRALLPMAALVKLVDGIDLSHVEVPTLVMYSPADTVVSPARTEARFAELGSYKKERVAVEAIEGQSSHVIAGDIVAPGRTDLAIRKIVAFVRGSL